MYGSSSSGPGEPPRPLLSSIPENGQFLDPEATGKSPEDEDGGERTYMKEMGTVERWIENRFQLRKRRSTIWREIRAGTATFLTMSYIVIVNARVAGAHSGIPTSDVMIGTAASSAVGSFVCGYFGNLPFALAPGLGLSAYLSEGLASPTGRPKRVPEWQTALAACAIAGIIQMLMARRLSAYLMKGTPRSVQVGTVVGMGLLIAFVALQEIGIVERAPYVPVPLTASNSTEYRSGEPLVQLGENVYSAESFLAIFGLVLVTFLSHHDVPGSVLVAVGLNTLISIQFLGTRPPEAILALPIPQKAFLAWDFASLTIRKHLPAVLAFILVGVFDVAGVMIGLSHAIGLEASEDGTPQGSAWAFFAAGIGTVVGAMFGSTPVIVHLESAAGL